MKTPEEILTESAETYRQKNADYGKSWQNIGYILHSLAGGEPVVLETPEDYISIGLFTRRLDKIARSFNGEFLSDEMNFESTVDAHEDESTYGAMHASLLRETESVEYVADGGSDEAGRPYDPAYEEAYQELRAEENE